MCLVVNRRAFIAAHIRALLLRSSSSRPARDPESGQIRTVDAALIQPPWRHMRDLLIEIGRIEPIRRFEESYLSIHTADVLARIQRGDPSWENMVLAPVAEMIKAKGLFGYQ